MNNGDKAKLITPDTKVGKLLDEYPELEETLIEIAPAFKKLTNPILRKTVAKVTSLKQADRVGDVLLPELINRLREAAGLEISDNIDEDQTMESRPGWMDQHNIAKTFDARPMLASGEQPMGMIMSELRALGDNQILELITPFLPAPIIDKARVKGFNTWSEKRASEDYRTYFLRN